MLHYIGSTWGHTNFTKYNNIILTYKLYADSTSGNYLRTLTQCNIKRGPGLTFSNGNTNCTPITSCVTGTLQADYCSANDKGLVCKDNYHWGKFNLI